LALSSEPGGGGAGHRALPDPHLTPGAIASTDRAEICAVGYTKAHRVWLWPAGKRETMAKYGYAGRRWSDYEDDDLIPICLGGDNASPLNHWPQPIAEAREKDGVEAEVCRAVCAGELTVEGGQRRFLEDRW